ncbi:phage baseplate protein [Xanthobacter agilis]|uniref:Dit-like phage tail protein N-terminal domain-containing protein n=1 Tax=Xanthobacter agilis TaxID=47492 RepID=A0ABU0LJU5_XANAG|nr:hypothetical protein [Xanthobacter agilis]MDQ0507415.1 hypothetical protein [Xanthobacter agilis]
MANIVEAVLGTVDQILVSAGASIGGIVPNVVVEEISRDSLFITNHPVEKGAAISDHAFMMPKEVELRCGWSDSGNFQGYSRLIQEGLLALQAQREPFTAVTSKRVYSNMLITGIEVSTSAATAYALFARVMLREVLIVSTSTVATNSSSTQADPARTSGTTNAGTKQATESSAGSTYVLENWSNE